MFEVFEAVKKDLDGRNQLGWLQHGQPLDPMDNRDWLSESYQEALDLCVYLRAQLFRRDGR